MILANPKHEAVALAYLGDPEKIGWRAYQAVYPKASRHACENGFTRMMKNEEFSARVAELAEQAAQGVVMSQREVLELLTIIARANMQDYVGDDDITKPIQLLSREQALVVQERTVEHYTEGRGEDAREVKRVKFKLPDKLRALELLGKHHALFTERHVHDFSSIAARLAAAEARVAEGAEARARPVRQLPDARRVRTPHKGRRPIARSRSRRVPNE
jgi:phage terminase small subunit